MRLRRSSYHAELLLKGFDVTVSSVEELKALAMSVEVSDSVKKFLW